MAGIELDGLTKQFGDVRAVRGIDLEVADGEFLVLVGPSGCGKSTTLRMIAGLEDVTDGVLRIGDETVTDLAPKDRHVAMVFQNYALYPHMTARRNMTFGMKSAGSYDDEEIARRVEEAADILDIPELLDRKPGELSGGERQRVAIGRAIVREPEVFLLDEPLSNLDAKLRVQMRAELLKLHQELRTTTVYVTHDQTEAMTLGDRVAVMDDGQIQQVDPPQDLYDYPANVFVAEFVGSPAMNVFDVEVVEDGAGFAADHDGFRVPLPGSASGADGDAGTDRQLETASLGGWQRSRARFGVRPEDVYLAGNFDGGPSFEAGVTVTEPLGESLLIHASVAGDEFQIKAEPRSAIRPGDRVELRVDPQRLHLFDPGTGEAVYHAAAGTRQRSSATSPDPE
ncbi:MAG: ABC transporter ATP-binding protein [Salinirussus sp.]